MAGQMRSMVWKCGLIGLLLGLLLAAGCGGPSAGGSASPAESGSADRQAEASAGSTGDAGQDETSGFPSHPIRIIPTHAPPGSVDTPVRLLQPFAEKVFGQPVVIENMPGAGGNIAREYVWNAEPDGYTLLISVMPSLDSGALTADVSFKPMEFEHVFNLTGKSYQAVAVAENSPYRSLGELIEEARRNPGKIRIAGQGIGSTPYLATKLVERATGAEFTYVPFDGISEAVTAVSTGEVDAGSNSLSSMLQSINDRIRLRILGIYGPERHPMAPDIPTAQEQGIDVVMDQLVGIFAPPGTPDEVVETLAAGFAEAVDHPEYQEQLENADMIPVFLSREDFKQAHQAIHDAVMGVKDALQAN